MNRIADILLAIIVVAGVTTAVAHPGTAKDITAGGKVFADSLRAAEGQ